MKPVLIVLANEGFDPSEAAVPWQALTEAGVAVVFATPTGQVAAADPLMVTGEGLDPWGWIPGVKRVKLVGTFLRANRQARAAYAAMTTSAEFLKPISYASVNADNFAGLLLPGGHAKTIKPYLESAAIQKIACDFMTLPEGKKDHKPVAAICHGVLILARAQRDKRSLLHGRKVTALTWTLEKRLGKQRVFPGFGSHCITALIPNWRVRPSDIDPPKLKSNVRLRGRRIFLMSLPMPLITARKPMVCIGIRPITSHLRGWLKTAI